MLERDAGLFIISGLGLIGIGFEYLSAFRPYRWKDVYEAHDENQFIIQKRMDKAGNIYQRTIKRPYGRNPFRFLQTKVIVPATKIPS